MIGVVRTVALVPREEGLRNLQVAALAAAYPLKHLRLLPLAAPLREEPRQLPLRGKTNRQPRRMTLLSNFQHLMLAQYMLGHGEDFEMTTHIALWNALTLVGISFSGPRHIM
jgi:hypothetical protein